MGTDIETIETRLKNLEMHILMGRYYDLGGISEEEYKAYLEYHLDTLMKEIIGT